MKVDNISIDSIGLSNRAVNSLHRSNIFTVSEMLALNEEDINNLYYAGKKTITEIIDKKRFYESADCFEEDGDLLRGEDYTSFCDSIKSLTGTYDFERWYEIDENKKLIIDYIQEHDEQIYVLESLSAKVLNILMLADCSMLSQVAVKTFEELSEVAALNDDNIREIFRSIYVYCYNIKDEIIEYYSKKGVIFDRYLFNKLITDDDYRRRVLEYVEENDILVERLDINNRAKNQLQKNNYTKISDIIFVSEQEILKIPAMGMGAAKSIMDAIDNYIKVNKDSLLALYNGNTDKVYNSNKIEKKILSTFNLLGFNGLTYDEIKERLGLGEYVTDELLKKSIGTMISNNILEYVDQRCYRVYESFEHYVNRIINKNDRNGDFVKKRLKGWTLEEIASEHSITRERVRQAVNRKIKNIKASYFVENGIDIFDEDYYRYLYESYDFDKTELSHWLGISMSVWHYFNALGVNQGKKSLDDALEDKANLENGLLIKLRNYVHRNHIYIDGKWISLNRRALERALAKRFCKHDITLEDFFKKYNEFLKNEDVQGSDKLYVTGELLRSRKNRFAEADFILYKLNERIRYYDISERDYSELLDGLQLDSYENTEISTLKLFNEHIELMKRFDLRDHYELHNLLRKIVQEGDYHQFKARRMPIIRFGEFDRKKAIMDIISENAPISTNDLVEKVYNQYGYDKTLIMMVYLPEFSMYVSRGVYSVDYSVMPDDHMERLKPLLTDDFYYYDEIKEIYKKNITDANLEYINSFNLKRMGFIVLSRYVIQHYDSLDAYFDHLFKVDSIIDITSYRKRFCYIQMFSSKFVSLIKNRELFEFEPNKLISRKRLEEHGVTLEQLDKFCNDVYNFVPKENYFTIKSIVEQGFESELFDDLGFEEWFYASLLIGDERFSYGKFYGTIVLYNGHENITAKSFESSIINKYGSIDSYDLLNELDNVYGCKVRDKFKIIYKFMEDDSDVFYDKILDRLYASQELYYNEVEQVMGDAYD